MVESQSCCWCAPLTDAAVIIGDRGTGGDTSSCTLRGVEELSVAKGDERVTSSIGKVDADAESYLPLMHMDVSCDVEVKWLTQEPAGKTFAFSTGAAAAVAFFPFLPFFPSVDADVEVALVSELGKTEM
jgi:hypothetical protein